MQRTGKSAYPVFSYGFLPKKPEGDVPGSFFDLCCLVPASGCTMKINNFSTMAKKLVCIVDDDADIREIYQRKFKREEFDVVLAEDGEKGLAVIRDRKPDIILLDIQMPAMDGFDVMEALREDPELSKIPVVVLSNVDDERTFKRIGAFETRFYLIKSLTTPQKAVDIVREVLH